MTGYVLRRTDQGGGYVARPGSEQSYTHNLECAQVFATREAADKQRCVNNEIIVALADLLWSGVCW